MAYHTPVLLHESVEGLNIDPNGIYIDVTFGGGGHSREILRRLKNGRLVAFDQDTEAEENVPEDGRFLFLRQNFKFLGTNLRYHGIDEVDGILADLGVSSHQFDSASRGFSFRMDGPLDMRMNPDAERSAADVVNTCSEEALSTIFFNYGELRNAHRIARLIVQGRAEKKIKRISDFLKLLESILPDHYQNKFLAKLFQALRIEVNQELESLKSLLSQSKEVLKSGGRLAVITYHSLEDRLVKNFIRTGNFEGERIVDLYGEQEISFKPVYRKVIVPKPEELEINPRSRSAKLRVGERVKNTHGRTD